MLHRLRQQTGDEGGFTLIELLVVVLIIGILSAIAIPAFLSQTSKANDSAAKTQVGTAQTTIETYANEHEGTFVGATRAKLEEIEPTLKDTTTATFEETSSLSSAGYAVKSVAKGTGDTFTLTNSNGTISRTCTTGATTTPANTGGGCKAGSW
jgi:type IV pilus assembly protein PilA